jgi:PPM family protein phosphatase
MPKTFPAFENQPESREGPSFLVADAQGPRDEQQDAAAHFFAPALGTAFLVVSDGIGGNSGGRIASQAVVESARELWNERNGRFEDPLADLDALCRSAHREMNRRGAKRGIFPRATVVALYLTPSQAFWVHSGDSRLYHFRSGKLLKRTEDDSVVQVMVKQGMLSEEEMGEHPDQGRLLRSLGGEEYRSPTKGTAKLTSRDAFLLCTDGFWERTKVDEMSELLFGPRSTAEVRLRRAVDRAVKRNGPKGDNVTAIVALPTPGADRGSVLPSHRWLTPALVALSLLLVLWFLFWPTKKEPNQREDLNGQNDIPGSASTPAAPLATTPGATPATTPGTTPATTPGATPATTPGATLATTPGATLATTPGATPATTSGVAPATTSGAVPATTSGVAPASTSGVAPASTSGAVPASTSGAVPATTTGAVPASTSGAVPASTSGAVPASTSGAVPASTSGAVPASTSGAVPASTSGAVPASTSTQMPTATPSATLDKPRGSSGQNTPEGSASSVSKPGTALAKPSQSSPEKEGFVYKDIKSISIDGKILGDRQ